MPAIEPRSVRRRWPAVGPRVIVAGGLLMAVIVGAITWLAAESGERVQVMRVEIFQDGDAGSPAGVRLWSNEEEGAYLVSGDEDLVRYCQPFDGQPVEVGVEGVPWSAWIRVVRVGALENERGFGVGSGIIR
jgi:hypothetical protein